MTWLRDKDCADKEMDNAEIPSPANAIILPFEMMFIFLKSAPLEHPECRSEMRAVQLVDILTHFGAYLSKES